jgi:hypothetical protein
MASMSFKIPSLHPRLWLPLSGALSFFLMAAAAAYDPASLSGGAVAASVFSLFIMFGLSKNEKAGLPASALPAMLLLGTTVRLALAYGYYGNFDMGSWEINAHLGVRGLAPYAHTERYNYAPVWFYLLTFLKSFHTFVPAVPFHFIVRAFLTLADLALLGCMLRLAKTRQISPVTPVLYFYLNPVSFLLTGFHGQIENLALVPLFAALAFAPEKGKAAVLGFCSTAALLIKHNIFYAVTTVLRYASPRFLLNLFLMGLAASAFILSFFPYWESGKENILAWVVRYQAIEGYGLTSFVNFKGLREICFLAAAIYPLCLKKKDVIQECLLAALFFLAVTTGIGIQYFVIPVLFAALRPSKMLLLYTAVATGFLFGSPFNVHVAPFRIFLVFGWNLLWAVTVFWFIQETRTRLQENRPASHA